MLKFIITMLWCLVLPQLAHAVKDGPIPTKKIHTDGAKEQTEIEIPPLRQFSNQPIQTINGIPVLRLMHPSHEFQFPTFPERIPSIQESVSSFGNLLTTLQPMILPSPQPNPEEQELIIPALKQEEKDFRSRVKANFRIKERDLRFEGWIPPHLPSVQTPKPVGCSTPFTLIPNGLEDIGKALEIASLNPMTTLGYLCPFPECFEKLPANKPENGGRIMGAFLNKDDLRNHIRITHFERVFPTEVRCPICVGLTLPSLRHRRDHMNNHHLDRTFYFCSECPEAFEDLPDENDPHRAKRELKEHILAEHSKDKPSFPCPEADCAQVCKAKNSLKAHLKKMHQKPNGSEVGQQR